MKNYKVIEEDSIPPTLGRSGKWKDAILALKQGQALEVFNQADRLSIYGACRTMDLIPCSRRTKDKTFVFTFVKKPENK